MRRVLIGIFFCVLAAASERASAQVRLAEVHGGIREDLAIEEAPPLAAFRSEPAAQPESPPLPPARPIDIAPAPPLPSIDFDDAPGLRRITAGPDADETRIIGLELRRHGHLGALVVTQGDDGLVATVTLAGTAIAATEGEPEDCLVSIVDDAVDDDDADGVAPIPIAAAGRPQGLLRYTLAASICPVVIDILDQAVLVRGPSACVIREANCAISPVGLWTPVRDRLSALGARSEGIAAIAERAIADNGPALAARSPGAERSVMRDLAIARRNDAAECTHFVPGPARRFCEARMAAARAADLSVRLGLYPGEGPLPPREPPPPAPPLRILPEEQPSVFNRERP